MKLRSQKSTSPQLGESDACSDKFVVREQRSKKGQGSRSVIHEEPSKQTSLHRMTTRNMSRSVSNTQHDTIESKHQARRRRRQKLSTYFEQDPPYDQDNEKDLHTIEEAREEHYEGLTHAVTRPRHDNRKQPRSRKPFVPPRYPGLNDPISAVASGTHLADSSNPAVPSSAGQSHSHRRPQSEAQLDAVEVDQSPHSPEQDLEIPRDLHARNPVDIRSALSQAVQCPPQYDNLPVPRIFITLPPPVTNPITTTMYEAHPLLPRHYRIPEAPLTTLGKFLRGTNTLPLPQAVANRIPEGLPPGDKITYATNLLRRYPEVGGAANQWLRFKLRDIDPPGTCGLLSWLEAEPDSGRRWRLYWAIYDAFAVGMAHGKHQAESEQIQRNVYMNPYLQPPLVSPLAPGSIMPAKAAT